MNRLEDVKPRHLQTSSTKMFAVRCLPTHLHHSFSITIINI